MKTINCNSCRAKIRKECEEDFLKHEYSIYQDLAFTFCCFSTAAVLMAHAQKGRSKKYIQALFNHLKRVGVGRKKSCSWGKHFKRMVKKKKFLKYCPTYCNYQYITP